MLVCLDVFGQTELEALIFRRNYATMGTPVHPWKQTWNLNISPWKRRTIYKPLVFGFHVLLMRVTYCTKLIDWSNFYTIHAEPGTKITHATKFGFHFTIGRAWELIGMFWYWFWYYMC